MLLTVVDCKGYLNVKYIYISNIDIYHLTYIYNTKILCIPKHEALKIGFNDLCCMSGFGFVVVDVGPTVNHPSNPYGATAQLNQSTAPLIQFWLLLSH